MRPISIGQWCAAAIGVFFIGVGVGSFSVMKNLGIAMILFGIILEIPAFYLVYKHKKE